MTSTNPDSTTSPLTCLGIVCNRCGGDTLGQTSAQQERKGFDAYCFDCEASVNTKEVEV